MKTYNIFDPTYNELITSVTEENLSLFIEYCRTSFLKNEMDKYISKLREHNFHVSDPEWFHDEKEFGFKCSSRHREYQEVPEKQSFLYKEVQLWNPGNTLEHEQ